MLLEAVSILPEIAPSSFGCFRALSGTFGRFQAVSGEARNFLKVPESARMCQKAPEIAPSSLNCSEQFRA
eukprot:5607171-Alexandrium_andersonii.AAC.1